MTLRQFSVLILNPLRFGQIFYSSFKSICFLPFITFIGQADNTKYLLVSWPVWAITHSTSRTTRKDIFQACVADFLLEPGHGRAKNNANIKMTMELSMETLPCNWGSSSSQMQARQLLLPSSSLHWCHCDANSLPSLPRFHRLFLLWIGLRVMGVRGGGAVKEHVCLSPPTPPSPGYRMKDLRSNAGSHHHIVKACRNLTRRMNQNRTANQGG